MSNCVKCNRRLKVSKDDMAKGLCIRCQSNANRANWKSMKRFKEQGYDVKKLPEGGFSIRGKKKEGRTFAEISEAERQKILPRGIVLPPGPGGRGGADDEARGEKKRRPAGG